MASEAAKRQLFDWHVARGRLMGSKRAHELTESEMELMKTPPTGWTYNVKVADWVYDEDSQKEPTQDG